MKQNLQRLMTGIRVWVVDTWRTATKFTERVELPATNPDNLSLILEIHMGKGELIPTSGPLTSTALSEDLNSVPSYPCWVVHNCNSSSRESNACLLESMCTHSPPTQTHIRYNF